MNWIFRTDKLLYSTIAGQKLVVAFTQKRNFTGKVGEDVLFLDYVDDKWQFTGHCVIVEVEISNGNEDNKLIRITLTEIEPFEQSKLLDDYIYSLSRITNFKNPIRHFSFKYNRLFDAELDAILQDKIYVKRTVLGTILNALHRDHQEEFIVFLAAQSPQMLTGRVIIDEVFSYLRTYLDNAIIIPALYLRDSYGMLSSIVEEEVCKQVGFAWTLEEVARQRRQLLAPQVELINQYLNAMPSYINELSVARFSQLEQNPEFEKLFKNSKLPISLN